MNIFQSSVEIKKVADAKNSPSGITSPDKIKLPYFKGNMKVKGKTTTSFIISYYTCLAACIVEAENRANYDLFKFCTSRISSIAGVKKRKPVPIALSIYVIEAVFSYEGYLHSDYATKTAKGYKRISTHLKAVSDREELNLSIDDQGTITGLTDKVVSAVLSAV